MLKKSLSLLSILFLFVLFFSPIKSANAYRFEGKKQLLWNSSTDEYCCSGTSNKECESPDCVIIE